MKYFLLALTVLLFGACSTAPRARVTYIPPSVVPVKEQVASAQTKVASAQVHAESAAAKLDELERATSDAPALLSLAQATHADVDSLTQELQDAQVNLVAAQTDANTLQAQVNVQTAMLQEVANERDAAILQAAEDRKHAHRLKLYICGIAAALAGFVVFHFKSLLLFAGPYGVLAFVAVPGAVFAALWIWL